MNRFCTTPSDSVPADEDLVEQAHPGHGVPSQDPASAAPFPLEPEEARREASSVLMGGGMVAGAAARATVGVVVAGPVGVVVGGPIRMKGEFKGKAYEDKGNIVTFEPPRHYEKNWASVRDGLAKVSMHEELT